MGTNWRFSCETIRRSCCISSRNSRSHAMCARRQCKWYQNSSIGSIKRSEIARSEWIREGRVPLQTLRADIDYATREANTIYGVLGVKVWLFKNEILKK